MKRKVPSDEVFMNAWNSSEELEDACRILGISRILASAHACKLRKSGVFLKYFGIDNLKAACEKCGKEFKTYKSTREKGKGRYCSRGCGAQSDKHGRHRESRTRLYTIWSDMKNRCFCKTSVAYGYYGKRGITVCEEWNNSYECFRDWAKSNGYEDTLELDRRDTNGNYCPENCRWATHTEQMRNTRKRKNAKTSKYKGVSWCSNNNKWRVQVCNPGKPIHRGLFLNELDAAKKYDEVVRLEFGEYALTNFKEGVDALSK